MSRYVFIWVTDPYSPRISSIHDRLIDELSNKNFTSNSEILEQNITRFTFIVNELTPNSTNLILNLISQINYYMVSIPLIVNTNDLIDADIIKASSDIIKFYTQKILNCDVSYITTTQYTDRYVFTPMLANNAAIYRPQDYIYHLLGVCNLNKFRGLQLLSSSPLFNIAINNVDIENNKIVEHNGIYFYPIDPIVGRSVNGEIVNLKSKGYFTITPDTSEDPHIYLELANAMKVEIIQPEIPLIFYLDPLKLDLGMRPESWFVESARKIRDNDLPRYLIKVPEHNRTVLYLAAIRSYTKVIQKNSVLYNFINKIKVFDDYNIEIPITNIDDVGEFKLHFNNILGNVQQWSVINVENLLDGVIKRNYLVENEINVPNLIVNSDGKEYLVISTSNKSRLRLPDNYDKSRENLIDNIKGRCNLIEGDDILERFNNVCLRYEPEKYEWSLRGLYTFDLLPGLISSLPNEDNIRPINSELVETDNLIEVNMGDTMIPIYEGKNIGEVKRLWEEGKFLSYWAKGYIRKFNKMSHVLIV